MNKTKIEWTDYSWNPITGCKHGCWYCYAKKLCLRFPKNFPNGFEPTFYPERLNEPHKLKKPSKIFVCSIADLFAPWTNHLWRMQVLESIEKCPVKHTFQLLTKNPEGAYDYDFPDNVWVGTTITDQWELEDKIDDMLNINAKVRFISFEPLLSHIFSLGLIYTFDWIIVGKLTGSKKIQLKKHWVKDIVDKTRDWSIPLFMKNNLKPIWDEPLIQEFPR